MQRVRSASDLLASAALGVGLLALVGVIAWHVLNPEPEPATMPLATTTNATEAVPTRTRDYREVAGWNLFGEIKADEAQEPTTVDDGVAAIESMDALPESSVRLEVTGTVAATDTDSARAIIMDDNGKQREYRIGDRLPGNIELHAVEPGRIVIRRNGALEAIALPKPNELLPDRKPTRASSAPRAVRAPEPNLVAHDEQ